MVLLANVLLFMFWSNGKGIKNTGLTEKRDKVFLHFFILLFGESEWISEIRMVKAAIRSKFFTTWSLLLSLHCKFLISVGMQKAVKQRFCMHVLKKSEANTFD